MISLYMQRNGTYNDNNTYISSNSHIQAQYNYYIHQLMMK